MGRRRHVAPHVGAIGRGREQARGERLREDRGARQQRRARSVSCGRGVRTGAACPGVYLAAGPPEGLAVTVFRLGATPPDRPPESDPVGWSLGDVPLGRPVLAPRPDQAGPAHRTVRCEPADPHRRPGRVPRRGPGQVRGGRGRRPGGSGTAADPDLVPIGPRVLRAAPAHDGLTRGPVLIVGGSPGHRWPPGPGGSTAAAGSRAPSARPGARPVRRRSASPVPCGRRRSRAPGPGTTPGS